MDPWLTAFIAIVTTITGTIVAFIAFLQWVTARQKIALDLFDKRFALYQELCGVIGRYGGQGPDLKDIGKFAQATSWTQFLFGPEVKGFLEERRLDLSREFVARKSQPVPSSEERRQADEDQYVARLNRLTDFFKDFDALVAPYMKHTQKHIAVPYVDAWLERYLS